MNTQKLSELIALAARALPNIRPLKEFLHLNLFPGKVDDRFWHAMHTSSEVYGITPFPSFTFYQRLLKSGEINPDLLLKEIKKHPKVESTDVKSFRKKFNSQKRHIKTSEKTIQPLHTILSDQIGYPLSELVDPQMTRMLSAFLDQGISFWAMPDNDLHGFYETISRLYQDSLIVVRPFDFSFIKKYFTLPAADALLLGLSELVGEEALYFNYIKESMYSLKGWAGMVHSLETQPGLISEKRKLSLMDFLAVKILLELGWMRKLQKKFKPISKFNPQPSMRSPLHEDEFEAFVVWHEAMESSYYQRILKQLKSHKAQELQKKYDVQTIFCIDDRECSLRRTLEAINPKYETFGTPGHFNLDFIYQESPTDYPKKHCPAPVQAKFLVREDSPAEIESFGRSILNWVSLRNLQSFTNFFDIVTRGLLLGVSLLRQVFMMADPKIKPIESHQNVKQLLLFRQGNATNQDGLFLGYSFEELAKRMYDMFYSIGLIDNFSPLIVLLGHGSHTTNNPYFTAYGCGACSGRPGSVNSKAFCQAANHPEVRKILREKHQLNIPEDTFFLAGYHDTCQDRIHFFHMQETPTTLHDTVQRFKQEIGNALKHNALLRCREFELVSKSVSLDQAVGETTKRSLAIFEPRPELGHTNNAICMIGKRSTTRGYSFERRAFLQSYNAKLDPQGSWLNKILSAAVPVCGGINLDYFFARMNNISLGASSKLAQNVVGLVGVSNGVEEDLLIGLPNQMIELHAPIRLLIIVEQKPSVVLDVITKNAGIHSWVKNYWVHMACLNPDDNEVYFYKEGEFRHLPGADIC